MYSIHGKEKRFGFWFFQYRQFWLILRLLKEEIDNTERYTINRDIWFRFHFQQLFWLIASAYPVQGEKNKTRVCPFFLRLEYRLRKCTLVSRLVYWITTPLLSTKFPRSNREKWWNSGENKSWIIDLIFSSAPYFEKKNSVIELI